jgi:hypothetical protein
MAGGLPNRAKQNSFERYASFFYICSQGAALTVARLLAPLRDSLRIDAQLPAQLRERSLRSLYCCSEGARGHRAPVTNLSHNAPSIPEKRSYHQAVGPNTSSLGLKKGGVAV